MAVQEEILKMNDQLIERNQGKLPESDIDACLYLVDSAQSKGKLYIFSKNLDVNILWWY
jgi:hypothetical protein